MANMQLDGTKVLATLAAALLIAFASAIVNNSGRLTKLETTVAADKEAALVLAHDREKSQAKIEVERERFFSEMEKTRQESLSRILASVEKNTAAVSQLRTDLGRLLMVSPGDVIERVNVLEKIIMKKLGDIEGKDDDGGGS